MKTNYKVILQYDGSRYDGWQKQGNTDQTIQGRLESVLSRLEGALVEVQGSGRTDAGVHALGQVANFFLEGERRPEEVMEELNRYLPEDIAVIGASAVSPRFHSRLNAVSKTYCYWIDMNPKRCVFERRYICGLGRRLDVGAMRKAAELLAGTHDFRSFCANKRMKKSTVRTLHEVRIEEKDHKLAVVFTGDGFLYQMVRIMAGTLIEVGLGKRSPGSIREILEARDRQAAGYTAAPEGLFLVKVDYHD